MSGWRRWTKYARKADEVVDVFVANAGTAISKPILEQTLDEYSQQMSVNRKLHLSSTLSIHPDEL